MKIHSRAPYFALRAAIAIISVVTLLFFVSPAPAQTPASGAPKITQNIPYVTGGGERQMMDVYANTDPKAPLIIWIHGGGWIGGSKSPCPAAGLVSRGFSIASINYRFTNTDTFPAQLHDCKAAVRYLRAHAKELGINADIIGVVGASAGGHLVSLLGVTGDIRTFDVGENLDQSSAVQLVINIVGPSDLARFDDYPNKAVIKMAEDLVGGRLKDHVEKVKAGSPLTYVASLKKAPPFLNLYGRKDDIVPCEQGEIFDKALREAKLDTTLKIYAEGTHSLPPESALLMVEFLEKHLLKK